MRYKRIENPFLTKTCFRELNAFVAHFLNLTKRTGQPRPNLYYNLGGMLACVLYARARDDYTWVGPFIDGVNSFMEDIATRHVEKDPVISACQHPDIAQV